MGADGLHADAELGRDLLLRATLRDEGEHLAFPFGQAGQPPQIGRRVRGPPGAIDESPHAGDELVGVHRLGRIIVGADEQSRDDVGRRRAVCRDEHDGHFRSEPVAQLAKELAPAVFDFEDRDCGSMLAQRRERVGLVRERVGGQPEPFQTLYVFFADVFARHDQRIRAISFDVHGPPRAMLPGEPPSPRAALQPVMRRSPDFAPQRPYYRRAPRALGEEHSRRQSGHPCALNHSARSAASRLGAPLHVSCSTSRPSWPSSTNPRHSSHRARPPGNPLGNDVAASADAPDPGQRGASAPASVHMIVR